MPRAWSFSAKGWSLEQLFGSGEEPEPPLLPAVIPTRSEDIRASVGAGSSPVAAPAWQRPSPPCALRRHQIGDAHHPATNDHPQTSPNHLQTSRVITLLDDYS